MKRVLKICKNCKKLKEGVNCGDSGGVIARPDLTGCTVWEINPNIKATVNRNGVYFYDINSKSQGGR